ncbi:mitochondrial protein from FMP27-domain-containing protein [Xylaria palmicola]|nr:mitochondrial protein from FMP27-domain-containing protein [Xylaria palmicola]
MGPRKRTRSNPSSQNDPDLAPSAPSSSSQSTGVASPPPNTPSSPGMLPTEPDQPNTSATTPFHNGKKVRKARSWYGSWPRVSKSSASTRVARENIMGSTQRSEAVANFSRFETNKEDCLTDPDRQATRTLPAISETNSEAQQNAAGSSATQPESIDAADGSGDIETTSEPVTSTISSNESAPQAPIYPTSWLSWLSRPTSQGQIEPAKDGTGNRQDSPETTEPIQRQNPQAQSPPETPTPAKQTENPITAKQTSSWFSFWYTSEDPSTAHDGTGKRISNNEAIVEEPETKEDEDTVMQDASAPSAMAQAPAPAPPVTEPSAGSTWAFWSRDAAPRKAIGDAPSTEQGELAVMGDGSETSPRKSSVEVTEESGNKKSSPSKPYEERQTKTIPVKKDKRGQLQSMEAIVPPVARPNTPKSDAIIKNQSSKTTTSIQKTLPPNLLLPSFRSTYRMKENHSIIKQITQLLLRTQQPPANHVFLSKETPPVRKAIAIGVHGLFPASYLRPMIGQPTGTSIKFANHCAEAIRRWAESRSLGDCEIEKVALEGEGKIADRVDNLWKLLLNWVEHIKNADLIMLACHSQGVPVGIMLLAKLIDLGVITSSRIGVCAMAGVSLGPFPDYKSGMGILMGSAAELWQFADPESEISTRYEHALKTVIDYGARITYVGSIDDQLVPLQSALHGPVCHPYIYRAVFIDGRIHAPDFIAHLVGFALKLRNLGLSDHGLIRELSVPLAGSLYSGEGHSRLYDDGQVYDLAISHALETTNVSRVPCEIQKHQGLSNPNPYILPWIMRGLLEEDLVKTELSHETAELLKQFDDWTPTTKALKDVKYRLEATTRRPSTQLTVHADRRPPTTPGEQVAAGLSALRHPPRRSALDRGALCKWSATWILAASRRPRNARIASTHHARDQGSCAQGQRDDTRLARAVIAMALLDPTFFFGVIVVLYLSSFVLFAVLRIVTGISIQRVGYFSLRRLAYAPRDGVKLEIRGLGLHLHRPTFSQPTWLSIVVSELAVTVDIKELEGQKSNVFTSTEGDGENVACESERVGRLKAAPEKALPRRANFDASRSATWKQLTKIKERLKKLHRNVRWLRMVDVVATDSTVHVVDVGKVQCGSFTVALDTRRRLVDRARFFFQSKAEKRLQKQPAEWIVTLKSILFTAKGGEPIEILDSATLNVHGFLYDNMDGLRDATVALKLGRVHVPYDDVQVCLESSNKLRRRHGSFSIQTDPIHISVDNIIREIDEPGSTDSDLVQAVSDSKEFVSSILRGIKEVQFAVSFVSLTKKVQTVRSAGSPLLLNASMKEVGVDLHRLDPKSPAHRMYFPSDAIAHEALAAALSISVGLDDGHGKPERIVYVPMATTTVKTTLPSKTVELSEVRSAEERNANILFANSVVTSPCVDLDPKRLPVLLALLQPKPKPPKVRSQQRHRLISRLLPKANIKFSMHEPVLRIALPPVQKTDDPDDYDLIISSISSVSLDLESFHSAVEDVHYSLASSMRVQTHHLYYRTTQGSRFDLVDTDSFDLKVQLSAAPDVHVVANGHLQTFAIRMTRPEITEGIRRIIRQLKLKVEPDKRATSKTPRPQNILRALPQWFLHFSVQVDDFSAEITGVDDDFPGTTRGVVLQVDTWTAEYRAQRMDHVRQRPLSRRRAASRSLVPDPEILNSVSTPSSPRKRLQHEGDGRRIAIHIRGLEAFVIEAPDKWEVEPFIHMPRFEVAFSTHSDAHSPILHVHSHLRTLLIQYSLFRQYSVGISIMVLRRAFAKDSQHSTPSSPQSPATMLSPESPWSSSVGADKLSQELMTVDCKAALIQIKAEMPADPPLMLQIYGMEAGRQRWLTPYFGAKLIRLHAGAPRMQGVWARIASIKSLRLDYRQSRKKTSNGIFQDDKLVDVVAAAVRLAVPHELIINKISDNIINVLKATQQLHHRFKTGTNEYILEKSPEKPKIVPKLSLRARNLMFELEDGAFEWKLGMIYRAGRVEQQQRIAREDAFRVKVKKIQDEEMKRDPNRFRNRSAMARGRGANASPWGRSKSEDRLTQHNRDDRSRSEAPRSRNPRYDPEAVRDMTGSAHITIQEARTKLHEHNAQSWKKRIDHHFANARQGIQELRSLFWGSNHVPDDLEDTERILEVPQRPALMATIIHELHVLIDKPSFPLQQLPEFLYQVGKEIPKDMKYSLLIPMNIQITMGEAKVALRDYPLPLLHVPALRPGQSSKLPALSLKTDFVIAEEFRGHESSRRIKVQITPPSNLEPGMPNGSFAIDVRRTIGPVKSYSDMYVDLNTANPTRITWGPSYQPAIQDMMMVIESFTKPQLDPSERVGFWDKIRLNFHSRVRVAWREGGDVHLALKGSRDPYAVVGNGAGFLMCWRNNVKWNVHTEDDPKRFMTVDSGEYVLAVPDFSHHAREEARSRHESESIASDSSYKDGIAFKKVIMKLSGNVQWMAGLVFERAIHNGDRDFSFKPHYDVILKAPIYAKSNNMAIPYDAFRGFRSQHIHLSIAVRAPIDRDWTSPELQPPTRSYNTVHLTPRFFTHFFAWWSLFSGPMSLPIRQGALWPGREKTSKKFGRHLGTIKYNLLLAPLFLSHIYKHKDAENYSENDVSATGIKVRFDSFMLDIHQRREEFNTRDVGIKTAKTNSRTTGMKIHAAQLDLLSADVRAVSASIRGTTTEAVKRNSLSTLLSQQDLDDPADLSHFTIPDRDFSWIDMDDFVELDWILPSEPNPDTKILPLAYSPRVTYFRQTDIGGTIDGDPDRTSPFGNEPTHFCIMRQDDDPRRVQSILIQSRLDQLSSQIASNIENVSDAKLRMSRDPDARAEYESLNKHTNVLRDKHSFMETMLDQMAYKITTSGQEVPPQGSKEPGRSSEDSSETGVSGINVPSGAEFASDFKNRFVVHNMQLKWNNLLRNIILRYSHQVSQRRGFVYYLSRPAVKFILDIVEEQTKAKQNSKTKAPSAAPNPPRATKPDGQVDETYDDIEYRIKQILKDGRKYVNADKSGASEAATNANMEDIIGGIAEDFAPQSSFHVRLIAPQIQLQSDKNKKHVILVTAKGMEFKVVEVMEKARLFDPVSGLVQRRFLLRMDSAQFFVTHQKWFLDQILSKYSGNRYGIPSGSSWPPWVPMEVMFDFQSDPFGFKRIVQKTSAMLRYDKFNTLRLKYNDEVNNVEGNTPSLDGTDSRMDNLWVEFPQARALCNSSQYYAMYVIVLDLLLYSEPLEKTRSERLEKIMLASDFSDLRGTPEMVTKLQERIRNLEEIKSRFQIHSKHLDRKGWEDRLVLERDLASNEDELFFVMKAITSSQRKYDSSLQSNALLRWTISAREIVWHLIQDNHNPLVELQLKDVEYDRTDNSDGSHINLLQIGRIIGLNLMPNAIYPEMIGPYIEDEKGQSTDMQNTQMIRVYFHMLEAIAGIPVMDHFEVNLFPMKIQLEREVGKKLFQYIFPEMEDVQATNNNNLAEAPMITRTSDSRTAVDTLVDDSMSGTGRYGSAAIDKESPFNTRAGSLELRLRPTLTLDSRTPNDEGSLKIKAVSIHSGEGTHMFRLFGAKPASKKPSYESLRASNIPKPGIGRSSTASSNSEAKKASRFVLPRKVGNSEVEPSDDLSKMITRASSYMTFSSIKMPSVVLCLSYKGKGERNIEDVHDFVFKLPAIEYRNKTWSNLDLAMNLKNHVIKALISHTGAIISNKFSRHRPNTAQQSKLRELATSSVLLATPVLSNTADNSDDSLSFTTTSPIDYSRSPPRSLRDSQSSNSVLQRSNSRSSSVASSNSYNRSGSDSRNSNNAPDYHKKMSASRAMTGLGIDMGRPKSSSSSSHYLEPARPSTSGSNISNNQGRRKSAGSGFLKGKFNALANRRKDRENSDSKEHDRKDG